MKIVGLLCAVLLLATTSAWADEHTGIRAFIAAYDRAYLASDTQTLGTMLATDYRVVAEGAVLDRAAALAEHSAPGKDKLISLSSTVDRIDTEGNLAVVIGRIKWAQANKNGEEHFTMALRREAGQWKAVAEHISEANAKAGT